MLPGVSLTTIKTKGWGMLSLNWQFHIETINKGTYVYKDRLDAR